MNPGSAALERSTSRGRWSAARLAMVLVLAALVLLVLGLAAGSAGLSWQWGEEAGLIAAIRAPRSLGALAAGGLLGLAGAIAQGLFRNPLADPYLLGSAAGAGFGVVLCIVVGSGLGSAVGLGDPGWLLRVGLALAAFAGALGGVLLTLLLAGGAARPLTLLLSGVVVGVLVTAVADLLVLAAPDAMRARQVFLLGTTGFLGWQATGLLAAALVLALLPAWRLAPLLDALVLGEATARSLGLPVAGLRFALVAVLALATGAAVAQVGLVAFVGLSAPHLVRRLATVTHRPLLALSALAGGVLLLAADVAARTLLAPQELPVGVLTAVVGGSYLLLLLHRRSRGGHG